MPWPCDGSFGGMEAAEEPTWMYLRRVPAQGRGIPPASKPG